MLFKYFGPEAALGAVSLQQQNRLLVDKIMVGDVQAESELVEIFTPSVQLILRRCARHDADREDLFQETFRIALEKIRKGHVRFPERLGGFMVKIAKYAAIDFYRCNERYKPLEQNTREKMSADSPLQSMITRERGTWLREAIPCLRCPRDRVVLQRFYLEEEDKQSICSDLGITYQNFNQIIYRAKKRLKKLLKRDQRFVTET